MKSIALISDIHGTLQTPISRKDNIKKTFLDKMDFVLKTCDSNHDVLLQAGDFCNQPREWDVLSELIQLIKKHNVKIYTIYGQHDLYMRNRSTSTTLSVLTKTGLVKALTDKPTYIKSSNFYSCFATYGASWGEPVPKPEKKMDSHICNVLVMHSPISDKGIFPGQDWTQEKHFLKRHVDYDIILVGDIHRKFLHRSNDNRYIMNTGPLLRLEANEYNMRHKPCFFRFNEQQTFTTIKVPCEKATKVLDRSVLVSSKHEKTLLEDFIKTIQNKGEFTSDVKQNVVEYCRKNKVAKSIRKILFDLMDGDN